MISSDLDNVSLTGQIILRPNISATWHANKLFIYTASAVAVVIATFFFFMGAWLILPFAGLEIMLLVSCLYYFYRHYMRMEVVHFTQDSIHVEKGVRQADDRWQCQRFWARIYVSDAFHPWYPPRIEIHCRGKTIEIGAFLNEEDKNVLVRELRKLIAVH